jgi:Tfp pilus assembly protein PilX
MTVKLRFCDRDPRGFVLVAALVALVIIALLITGAFFAGGQDLAVSRAELRDRRTLGYAEYAQAHAIEAWNAADRERMAIGETASFENTADTPLESTVFITRLDSALYSIVAEARLVSPEGYGLKRRVGIVVKTVLRGARLNPPARIAEQSWTELY